MVERPRRGASGASGMNSTIMSGFSAASSSNPAGGEELADLQGLSLDSSPVKPSSSSHSSEPSSAGGLPMFVQEGNDIGDDIDDDDDDEGRKGKKGGAMNPGRRKIEIEYIEDKSKRHITFSKRKAGIMKKAYELSTLTGTQVLLLVVSETGLVYTYTTNKLQPLVTAKEGKALIQACLTAEEGEPPFGEKGDGHGIPATPTRARADHRKVSMQVRMDQSPASTYTPPSMASMNRLDGGLTSPSYPQSGLSLQQQQQAVHQQQQRQQAMMQQQGQQQHAPQMMQPPYMGQQPQQMPSGTLMPSAPLPYGGNNQMMNMQGMPTISPGGPGAPAMEQSASLSRTLKKRKTVDNLRTGKETAQEAEARRNEATQIAQECLEQARANATLGNLLRAYQQQDIATRKSPPKRPNDTPEPLDQTIHLFQMSCEDGAKGPEADQARLRGDRWMEHVGIGHLGSAYDHFFDDFLVNKCVRPPKDNKASAKDLQNFTDWLFAHSFITAETHGGLVKRCNVGSKPKKKGSESNLAASTQDQQQLMYQQPGAIASGMVRPPSNSLQRAETAGKTLIEFCEFARKHYEGLGQDQGHTALNGYFSIDRIRSTYCILRGIPIQGDMHSNSDPGPFKVRMPRALTGDLRPRDQFLLSLNRYPHLNYWIPTACGDVHPASDEGPEDLLNPQYHQMELERAQSLNDNMAFEYHAAEYAFSTKAMQFLQEGEVPEDGFGGVRFKR